MTPLPTTSETANRGTPAASPTLDLYVTLERAYDHFNAELFGDGLTPCLISLRSSSRVYGYHHHRRFIAPDGAEVDELGLHPGFFALRPVEEVLSTLVHEMAHHWQNHHGTPTRSTAHNREWAAKMDELGLVPSSSGLPGGKRTGRSVSHWIRPQGAFLVSCRRLLESGFRLPWLDRHAPGPVDCSVHRQAALKAAGVDLPLSEPPGALLPAPADGLAALVSPPPRRGADRVRFTCAACKTTAWAKAQTPLRCGVCGEGLQAAE